MRKLILTVLFCLGLFFLAYSQETAPEVDEVSTPKPPVVPAKPSFPGESPMSLPKMNPNPMGMGMGIGMGMGSDPRLATGMREHLTLQLRDISRFLGQADPRDTQFIEYLRNEQASVLEQLKSLGEPTTRAVGNTDPIAPNSGAIQPTNDFRKLQNTESPSLPPNWQQMSPEEFAQFFAEQQKQTPANRSMPQMPPRNFQSKPAPFGGGVSDFGGIPAQPPQGSFALPQVNPLGSPWGAAQPPQEISELKETISTLQTQIEQMRDEIKALNAQMQLLNQNILLKMK